MKRNAWKIGVVILALGGFAQRARAEVVTSPGSFGQVRAYPNPWKSDKHAKPEINFDGFPQNTVTTLRIFTISGELVRKLSGMGSIPWDLRNGSGETVASGVYIYIATANNEKRTGKVAIIR